MAAASNDPPTGDSKRRSAEAPSHEASSGKSKDGSAKDMRPKDLRPKIEPPPSARDVPPDGTPPGVKPLRAEPPEAEPPKEVPPRGTSSLESTETLILFAQRGDKAARNLLMRRFLPVLTRWAHGRLPSYARDLSETGDLVQKTLMKALRGIDRFENRKEGAFLSWLRTILINEVRDEIRSAGRRPWKVDVPEELATSTPSPLARVLTQETFAVYEAALGKLRPRTREAVILRLEFGYTYPQIAEATGSTENATRMLVSRAVVDLAKDMSAAGSG